VSISVSDLIGKPFEYNARGPEKYDCWGLVMEMQRRNGIKIPDYESPTAWQDISKLMRRELVQWERVDQEPYSVMYMKLATQPSHVGVYLGFGKFIHASESSEMVRIERIRFWENNIVGYYKYIGA